MPSEFALIERYFKRAARQSILGVGDDGAIVRVSPGHELVISTDMLVSGAHFLPDTDPENLGWKVLAVNVSDMAAMGAQPRWAVLAAALPVASASWIEKFAHGFFACADEFDIDIIGGDTTKGPCNFCVTIFGEVPQGKAMLRSGAKSGDEIWVSGFPGRAAQGLAHLQGKIALNEPARTDYRLALERPQPRVALGLALRDLATAAIDVSDGLLADLGHVLDASGVAANLRLTIPSASTFTEEFYLSGGDDYELVFTVPANRHQAVLDLGTHLDLNMTHLGNIETGTPGKIDVFAHDGRPIDIVRRGYDHFA